MFGLLLRRAYADHQAQETLIRQSDVDWIIVRPSAFTDEPPAGAYRHGRLSKEQSLQFKIPRADVANFMLQQLTQNNYLRQSPMLSQ